MEGLGVFVIYLVVILNIILFFKLWGMTINVKKLVSFYMHENSITVDKAKSDSLDTVYADKEGKEIKYI
jgi:hypothetical protein